MANVIPSYDYSFIKKINDVVFDDFNDLIESYLSNIQSSIFVNANILFEKGFKCFLIQTGKMEVFFPYADPNLTQMVFSYSNSDSKDYIRNNLSLDYDLIARVRDKANNKKHDTTKSNTYLDKVMILAEIFSLYVQINNMFFTTKVKMPSKEYLEYMASFDTYKEHKFEEVIEKRLLEVEDEVSNRLTKINEEIEEKENKQSHLEKKLKETSKKILESEREIESNDKIIAEKERRIRELDEILSHRRLEIVNYESTSSNNDLYELANKLLFDKNFEDASRVFKNLQTNNIQDLRAYIGLLLCYFKTTTIDDLISIVANKCKDITKIDIFIDAQKFLKDNDKELINEIIKRINEEKAIIQEEKNRQDEYNSRIFNLQMRCDYDYVIEGVKDKNVTELIIPNEYKGKKIGRIEIGAFERLFGLKSVVISDGIETIEQSCFGFDSNLKDIKLPNDIKSINQYAFFECYNIEKVFFPKSLKHLGTCAFRGCYGLLKVEFEVGISIEKIEDLTFYGCSKLKDIILPESIKTIGAYSFYGCRSLKSVYIPSNVTKIEKRAFCECPNIETIVFGGTLDQWDAIDMDLSWIDYLTYCTLKLKCTDRTWKKHQG